LFPVGMRRLWGDSSREDQLCWTFYCVRLQELLYEGVLRMAQEIQAGLTSWGQELNLARRKLAEFPARLGGPPERAPGPRHPALGEMLPFGTGDLGSAVKALLAHLPVDLPRQFDLLLQAEVLDVGGGLWGLLTGKADVSRLSFSRSPASVAF